MNTYKLANLTRHSKNLKAYAERCAYEFFEYNDGIHLRIVGEYAVIDVWPTTGRYWVKDTTYLEAGWKLVERAGEKGFLPNDNKKLEKLLDSIFFAGDLLEVSNE